MQAAKINGDFWWSLGCRITISLHLKEQRAAQISQGLNRAESLADSLFGWGLKNQKWEWDHGRHSPPLLSLHKRVLSHPYCLRGKSLNLVSLINQEPLSTPCDHTGDLNPLQSVGNWKFSQNEKKIAKTTLLQIWSLLRLSLIVLFAAASCWSIVAPHWLKFSSNIIFFVCFVQYPTGHLLLMHYSWGKTFSQCDQGSQSLVLLADSMKNTGAEKVSGCQMNHLKPVLSEIFDRNWSSCQTKYQLLLFVRTLLHWTPSVKKLHLFFICLSSNHFIKTIAHQSFSQFPWRRHLFISKDSLAMTVDITEMLTVIKCKINIEQP